MLEMEKYCGYYSEFGLNIKNTNILQRRGLFKSLKPYTQNEEKG